MHSRIVWLLPILLAADWPQWRGPNRDGVAVRSGLPERWPAQPAAPTWRVEVGPGDSSPVVAADRVFVLAGKDGVENGLCFDAKTGKQLWRFTYSQPFRPPADSGGLWPKSTPTVDGDRVYMLGLGGHLHCLDVTNGKVLWLRELTKDFWGVKKDDEGDDAWAPPCGCASSPLVDGERVIVSAGGEKAGAFIAFDHKTGKTVWTSPIKDRGSYSSPRFETLAGQRQLVGFTGLRMVGLDAKDRKLLWEYDFPARFQQTAISPLVWKDHVIIAGEAKPTVALAISKSNDGFKTKVAWKNPDARGYMASPVIVGDLLIAHDHLRKRLVGVNLSDGATAWTSKQVGEYVSLVVDGQRVLALTEDGELIVLAANPKKYEEIARWKVSDTGHVWSYLAVSDGRLFVKDKTHLASWNLR